MDNYEAKAAKTNITEELHSQHVESSHFAVFNIEKLDAFQATLMFLAINILLMVLKARRVYGNFIFIGC